ISVALEALPGNAIGQAFIEVAEPEDEIPLIAPEGVQINWILRGGRADLVGEERAGDHSPLVEAVKTAHWLPGQVHAFVHGEAQAVMHNLRPYIRKEHGVEAKWASISGYWRRGRTEETFREWKRELAEAEAGNQWGLVSPGVGWHAHRMAFGDYQNEIYFQGLSGVVPKLPMVFAEWEAKAKMALPPSVWSYVAGGAGDERTQRANCEAFGRWGLIPRMFVGAAQRGLAVALFGHTVSSPVFMAPIGVIGLCAQDGHGDLATARAAAHTGVPMVASTLTVDPMEDVTAALGDTPGFFQLYTPT